MVLSLTCVICDSAGSMDDEWANYAPSILARIVRMVPSGTIKVSEE